MLCGLSNRFVFESLDSFNDENLWKFFFELLRSAAIEGMGVTVLARTLVAPPLRIVSHNVRLPELPTVELVYSQGKRNNSRVVSELADYLTDNLANSIFPARSALSALQ